MALKRREAKAERASWEGDGKLRCFGISKMAYEMFKINIKSWRENWSLLERKKSRELKFIKDEFNKLLKLRSGEANYIILMIERACSDAEESVTWKYGAKIGLAINFIVNKKNRVDLWLMKLIELYKKGFTDDRLGFRAVRQ